MQDQGLQDHGRKLKRRRPRKVLTLDQVLAIQSSAIEAAWEAMVECQEMSDQTGVIRATHAISQAAATFGKLIETKDLERRIAELEAAAAMRPAGHGSQLARAYA